MGKEEWVIIDWVVGYEGIYSISNTGSLKSNKTGKYKKGVYDKDGYVRYHLYNKGKQKAIHAHRLVLTAFKGVISDKTLVDHIDGVRDNNNLDNLRWCTVTENNRWGNNSNNVSVLNIETGESKEFFSLSQASVYFGYERTYFSNMLRDSVYENKKFKIKLLITT